MKYYVKNIILALKDGATVSCFLPLVERLRVERVPVQAFLAEEELPQEWEALYITDCRETAQALAKQEFAVLGYCHGEEWFSGIRYLMENPEDMEPAYLERVYRRYRGIPWDILETERCILRETVEEDVDAYFEIYSNPDIVRYTERLYPEKEQEKEYIRKYIDTVYRYYEYGVWTVLWKETGEIIGRAGISMREGYSIPELGFVIGVPWQGKGVAYEICRAILRYGKEEHGFEQIQALVRPQNNASLALCRKLGFATQKEIQREGVEYLLLIAEL